MGTLPLLFFASALLCIILWIFPLSGWTTLSIWISLILLSFASALIPALRPLPSASVLRDLDQGLQTEDLAVTVGDPSLGSAWRDLLLRRLQPHLASLQISRIWPLNSSGLQKIWIVACLLMGGNVLLTAVVARPSPEAKIQVSEAANAALEEMFDDWQETAPEIESEEFEAILAEVEELRTEMDPSQQTPSERMELLSKIEAIVERHKKSQSESSIAEHADNLAELLEPVEGMSGAAAALRRGDFSDAGQSLEEMVSALKSKEKLPPEATSQEFQNQAAELAEAARLAENLELAENLQNLSEAALNQNATQWCESAKALGQCMNKEGARALAARLMQAQLDQLEAQKFALSQQKSPPSSSLAALLPQSSGGPPNLQAGVGNGGAPFGAATQPDGQLETLALSGTMGQGDSTRETVRSSDAPTEALRVGRQATFEEYQNLSTQAIHDESLPLVHRETIRRYFERIRPSNSEN